MNFISKLIIFSLVTSFLAGFIYYFYKYKPIGNNPQVYRIDFLNCLDKSKTIYLENKEDIFDYCKNFALKTSSCLQDNKTCF